jgi:hypothetical protein
MRRVLPLVALIALPLGGCAVVEAGGAVVSAAGTVVGAAASATGAAVDAATGDNDENCVDGRDKDGKSC